MKYNPKVGMSICIGGIVIALIMTWFGYHRDAAVYVPILCGAIVAFWALWDKQGGEI